MKRTVLMIEIDGDAATAVERLGVACPDAQVWGEVDPVDAALYVLGDELVAA
jgi:hypothetical protein